MRGHSDRVKGWRGGRGSGGGEKEGEAEGEEEGGLCGCNHRGFLERRVDGSSWEPLRVELDKNQPVFARPP